FQFLLTWGNRGNLIFQNRGETGGVGFGISMLDSSLLDLNSRHREKIWGNLGVIRGS
ncbi:hypothetical protein L9F63_027166, partial [Diploptera punctata]